ncbi:uncharacterized protein LOC131250593 [Magnolia sinica]|uniref:uncharacterized protein LOC131250593 n=1 Tax=Magnolia sinica TaxID=86752 RepID=UPI0026585062|nr:uncharacterized protein LOC131250593 [Magnolia sinica]
MLWNLSWDFFHNYLQSQDITHQTLYLHTSTNGWLSAIIGIQFADNTLILSEASSVFIDNLCTALRCFEAVSGLRINLAKSKLFGVNLSEAEISNYADTLGCPSASFPSFVGLPLAIGPPTKSMWDKIVGKFQKYLARWKCRYLLLGGRLTLIKADLSNLPLYYMSLFRCPSSVLLSIDKLRRDFLWCGKENQKKLHLLDWKEVCKHFQEGGASVKILKIMNQALLGGWWTKDSSAYRASFLWKGILGQNRLSLRVSAMS